MNIRLKPGESVRLPGGGWARRTRPMELSRWARKALLLCIPPGETAEITCPVHGRHVLHGPPVSCGCSHLGGLER